MAGYKISGYKGIEISFPRYIFSYRNQVTEIDKPSSQNSKLSSPRYNMHVKKFVFASLAACIVTAIPMPSPEGESCPANWKRSAQAGCVPQKLQLPSLNDLHLEQQPHQSTGLEIYPTDDFQPPSQITPDNTAVSAPPPAPQRATDYAPWLALPGAAGLVWGLQELSKNKPNFEIPGNGN